MRERDPNTIARLLVLDPWIQRRYSRRSGDIDRVFVLAGFRVSVVTRKFASVCLDVAIDELAAGVLDDDAVARERIARTYHLPRDVGRIAARDLHRGAIDRRDAKKP